MSIDPVRRRWRDLPDRSDRIDHAEELESVLESAAGDLFRAVPPPTPRRPQAAANLFAQLRERKKPWTRGLHRVFGIRRLAAALSLFLSVNLAMAITFPPAREWWSRVQASIAQVLPARASHPPGHGHAVSAMPPPISARLASEPSAATDMTPALASPVDGESGLLDSARPPRRASQRFASLERHDVPNGDRRDLPNTKPEPAPPAPSVAPPRPESLAGESDLLSGAVTALSDGQPAQALAALATYQRQFPRGKMGYEATLAEVKARMATGDTRGALAALERAIAMPGFDSMPRHDELTLLHAELQARAGDCAHALAIFDRLATSAGSGGADDLQPHLLERALYGRASCLASQGDGAGSRKALHEYLRRFKNGRFASAAQAALKAEE